MPRTKHGSLADDAGTSHAFRPLRVALGAVAAVDDLPGAGEQLEGFVVRLVADSDPGFEVILMFFFEGKKKKVRVFFCNPDRLLRFIPLAVSL